MEVEISGTPATAEAEAASNAAAPSSQRVVPSARNRRLARQYRHRGLVANMGRTWGGAKLRLRSWKVPALIEAIRAYEKLLRARNPQLKKGDPLPDDEAKELGRYSTVQAITGVEGSFEDLDGKTHVFEMPAYDDGATIKDQRDFLVQNFLQPQSGLAEGETYDERFQDSVVGLMDALDKVDEETVASLGEDFELGLSVVEG